MKVVNRTRLALFTMLIAISILPGCGKKNDGAAINGIGGLATIYPVGSLVGNCFNVQSVPVGQGMSLTFTGSGWINPNDGALQATVQGAATGLPSPMYTRTNFAGDSLQVYVAGNTVYAVANLAPNTVSWFRYYNTQVCGLQINSPISAGNITMSAQFMSSYGAISKSYISL